MTRGRKRWLIAIGVLAAVVAGDIALTRLSYTDLDKAILRDHGRRTGVVTDIVARHVPADFEGAVKALRDYGLVEGNLYVGATYRRRAVPKPDGINRRERANIKNFNRLLDREKAVLAKPFERKLPKYLFFFDTELYVYLLVTKDGDLRIFARTYSPLFQIHI